MLGLVTTAALPLGCRIQDQAVDSGAGGPSGDTAVVADHVVINELMADNQGIVQSPGDAPGDWIELHNPLADSVDLSGWSLSDQWTDPGKHRLPDGVRIPAGGHLLLWADGDADAGAEHLGFRLDAAGEGVGLFDPDGQAVDWVLFGPQDADQATARLPDGGAEWVSMPRGTPGQDNALLAWQATTLMPENASWLYWDKGTTPAGDWTADVYDDSAWQRGPGPLGYGDKVASIVGYGPDPHRTYITTWFRTEFALPSTLSSDGRLALGLRCDDGGIVYLDGAEAFRLRMPDGPVDAQTEATANVSGDDETTYTVHHVAASALSGGSAQLAVEVHQSGTKSTDMSMAMTASWEELAEVE